MKIKSRSFFNLYISDDFPSSPERDSIYQIFAEEIDLSSSSMMIRFIHDTVYIINCDIKMTWYNKTDVIHYLAINNNQYDEFSRFIFFYNKVVNEITIYRSV